MSETGLMPVENQEAEFEAITAFTKKILGTKHYAKMNPTDIFLIVQKCRVLGIHPLEGLNGGMYTVGGRIEMSSEMMNRLIRMRGNSITRLDEDDGTSCILRGKRADNGDTWTTSFTMEDARLAGLGGGGAWKKFPKAMLFARCLSKLARQLFPDAIANCYVKGEISGDKEEVAPVSPAIEAKSLKDVPTEEAPEDSESVDVSDILRRLGVTSEEQLPEQQRELVNLYRKGALT